MSHSGPGLAFIAYPRAVSMMPFSPLWAFCFFIMIVFLGLDSQVRPISKGREKKETQGCRCQHNLWYFQFVCLEGIATAIMDMYPSVFRRKHGRELLILAVVMVMYLLGLIMLTEVCLIFTKLWFFFLDCFFGFCLLFFTESVLH